MNANKVQILSHKFLKSWKGYSGNFTNYFIYISGECQPGFKSSSPDTLKCEPINRCLNTGNGTTTTCHANASCHYLGPDQFLCTCHEGYTGNGTHCSRKCTTLATFSVKSIYYLFLPMMMFLYTYIVSSALLAISVIPFLKNIVQILTILPISVK